uniref:DNA repair protein complementing XP-C cells isoform X1 n=3 Tax=Myxine glutinosa TaxID=7769 RepID=UPI00358E7AE2
MGRLRSGGGGRAKGVRQRVQKESTRSSITETSQKPQEKKTRGRKSTRGKNQAGDCRSAPTGAHGTVGSDDDVGSASMLDAPAFCGPSLIIPNISRGCVDGGDESEESTEEWEEVAELPMEVDDVIKPEVKAQQPLADLQIEIETPAQVRERKRKQKQKELFEAWVRRSINRYTKELQTSMHKVHLLCLLGNGFYRNYVCCHEDLKAMALSLVPHALIPKAPCRVQLSWIQRLLTWFSLTYPENLQDWDSASDLVCALWSHLQFLKSDTQQTRVHVCLLALRGLGVTCRLVLSLQPLTLRVPAPIKNEKQKPRDKQKQERKKTGKKQEQGNVGESRKRRVESVAEERSVKKRLTGNKSKSGRKEHEEGSKEVQSEEDVKKTWKEETCKEVNKAEEALWSRSLRVKNLNRRSVASKLPAHSGLGATEQSGADGEETNCSKELSSEDDFEPNSSSSESEASGDWGQRSCSGNRKASKRARAVLSKQQEKCEKKEEQAQGIGETKEEAIIEGGCDAWLEVWVVGDGDGVQGSWVRTDVAAGMVACTVQQRKLISYVVAFEADGSAKDVTRRYAAATWLVETRRFRVDSEWWEKTLAPYSPKDHMKDRAEEHELQQKMYQQPMPTKVAAFKNHPLYVLSRHLLKFQAIYPLSTKPLGNYRGEPIYARECVQNLHSQDTWLKQARVVCEGEVPCKMVKGHSNRARKARANDTMAKDAPDLPLFGAWQTEEYNPPVASGGKVPRNDFGNVYLFRPTMLPIGCRHLPLPGLQRVARKLDIDCAAAVTGFDFHSGFSHPVLDGWVVCEESSEVLIAAWEKEQKLSEKRDQERRARRVADRWHLLAKGLLIRERLQKRYGGVDKDPSKVLQSKSKNNTSTEQSPIRDQVRSWPQVRPGIQAAARGQGMQRRRDHASEEANLFPFEKL